MRIPQAARTRGGVEVNLTPMIDMVFLLMIYFVVTYGSHQPEDLLPSALAAAESGSAESSSPPPERPEISPLVIRVLATPTARWSIDGQPVASLAAVGDTLRAVARVKRDVPVIVHPDPAVSLGDVVEVYDLARLAGFAKIQFTAAE